MPYTVARFDRDKAARDAKSLDVVPQLRYAPQVIAPTVTRRPAIDSMFGDIAIVGSAILHQMRVAVQSGDASFDKESIDKFRQISEIAIKQARVEMAVEKHVEERASGMDNKEVAQDLSRELNQVLMRQPINDTVRQNIVDICLMTLGLDG